jgi:hypothetical protein
VKKLVPYGIIALVVLALGILLLGSASQRPKQMDERISLRQKDKVPYGFYAVRNLVPSLFPNATIYADKRAPGFWDSLSLTNSNQAVILVASTLNADSYELERLLHFVKKGNYVFIITKFMSYEANNFFGFTSGDIYSEDGLLAETDDSLKLKLGFPRFDDTTTYTYPGKRHAAYYSNWDKEKAVVLGSNGSGYPNFLQFRAGDGALFIHTAPLAFSNYFVLHKDNIHYLEEAFSVIPDSVNKIVWSEYYLTKKSNQPKEEPNILSVLFRYSSFKWAFLTAFAALLLYVLLEMRRKQRIIPVVQKPRNDSLDFVQTIGRLYYDRKDHGDLARKMSQYFLDHIRTRYKLPTQTLDENLLHALHAKSGYDQAALKNILDFIGFISITKTINEEQLMAFHNQLESFYQNT